MVCTLKGHGPSNYLKFLLVLVLILTVSNIIGCKDDINLFPPIGGPCEYITIAGTATIVSVDPVTDSTELNWYSCGNDPVEVKFEWDPINSSDVNLDLYFKYESPFT